MPRLSARPDYPESQRLCNLNHRFTVERPAHTQSDNAKKRLVLFFKLAVVALVVWGIWRAIGNARDDFNRHEFSLSQVQPGWLLAAAVCYLLGMLPMGLFWFQVLRAMGQSPRLISTLRAFYIGHLGKYVPGKAMVVVLRAGSIRGPGIDTAVAALSVFVETFTMMAVGAFVAATIVLIWLHEHSAMMALGLGLLVATGVPTLPPIFRKIVRALKVGKVGGQIDRALAGLTFRVMAVGWAANLAGWTLLGMSYWLTLRSVPTVQPLSAAGDVACVIASTSLAMVAGFVSLLPGGVGVREWILTELMGPLVGAAMALVSALLLRLVWLAAELAAAALLFFVPGPRTIPDNLN